MQPITSIINNVRSVDDYDLQTVQPTERDVLSNADYDDVPAWDIMSDEDFDVEDYFEMDSYGKHIFQFTCSLLSRYHLHVSDCLSYRFQTVHVS